MSADPTNSTPQPTPRRRKLLRLLAAVGVVALLAGLVFGFLMRRATLSADDPPEKVYQKIFAAYGGQKALDRWKCGRLKYELISNELQPSQTVVTETFWVPGRSRTEFRETGEGRTKLKVFGSNGHTDWMVDDGGRVAVRPALSIRQTDHAQLIRFYHPFYILRSGDALAIKGVEVRPDGGRDLVLTVDDSKPELGECRVDMKTKLLQNYRAVMEDQASGQAGPGRYEYSDYQQTEGGPFPGRLTMFHGDRKGLEYRFVSVEFKEDFEPIAFKPPEQ